MIKFEKVSLNEYINDRIGNEDMHMAQFKREQQKYTEEWENIKLPTRSTSGSAGYDFYMPYEMKLNAPYVDVKSGLYGDVERDWKVFSTGIRFVTDRNDIVLLCVPRSGLGFKNITRLANTVGVIDSDYCQSSNEGHIKVKMTADKEVCLDKGKAFMQAIIVPFIKTDDDVATEKRDGGFGSTDTSTDREKA